MTTHIPKNVELRSVPTPAFVSILSGSWYTTPHLKSSIGMKCSAPYSGRLCLKTNVKRSQGMGMHESNHGWTASHGPKGEPKSGGDANAIAFR